MKLYLIFATLVIVWAIHSHAAIRAEEVEYRHGDTVLQGYLAYDDQAEAPQPGVLVVHEWWGHDEYARRRAEQLAELGYVAFALDMYGKGVHTNDPARAGELAGRFAADRRLGRDRARAGLEVLQNHQRVDADRIAAIGYCFGGTVALELARDGAGLAGVVSFHGNLATPDPDDARNITGRVLVLHGADDPLVPPQQVAAFEHEMREAGADWQLISYGGARHSFSNPQADEHNIPGVAYDERAERRSWAHMKVFFDEIFNQAREAPR